MLKGTTYLSALHSLHVMLQLTGFLPLQMSTLRMSTELNEVALERRVVLLIAFGDGVPRTCYLSLLTSTLRTVCLSCAICGVL